MSQSLRLMAVAADTGGHMKVLLIIFLVLGGAIFYSMRYIGNVIDTPRVITTNQMEFSMIVIAKNFDGLMKGGRGKWTPETAVNHVLESTSAAGGTMALPMIVVRDSIGLGEIGRMSTIGHRRSSPAC